MKYSKSEREEALATLRELCPPGTTVYTKLNHVSRSGMSRSITPLILKDGALYYLTWRAGAILGLLRDRYEGLPIGGCGMDMGFSLVYNLSHYLFPDGFGLEGEKEVKVTKASGTIERRVIHKRPRTKAEAARMVAAGWKFHGRNGDTSGWDSSGGYALEQRWV